MANDWGDEVANDWGDLPDGAAAPAPAKQYPFDRRKMLGALPDRQGPLEAGLRVAGSGATFGLDAPVRGLLHAATSGKSYQEARRETDANDAEAYKTAGDWALPLSLAGGAASSVAGAPFGLTKALAPLSHAMGAPGRGLLSLLGRTVAGVGEASGVSAGLGAIRGAGTDKGAAASASEASENPMNLLGGVAGAASWAGARARPASQEAAANYLRLDPAEIDRTHGGPGVPVETSMRRAGQRAIDLEAVEPGQEMGRRAVDLKADNMAARDEAVKIAQDANVRGATVDRTQLLIDMERAIKDWLDIPGTREANKAALAEADKVLQNIVNDNDLRTGAPVTNFLHFKEKLQGDHFTGTLPMGTMRDTLEKALREAARVVREHTEAAITKVDPAAGARFKAMNKRQHENIPIEQGAQNEAQRRLTGRLPGDPSAAYGVKSLVERAVSGSVLRDTAPYRIKMNRGIDALYKATPDNAGQALIQMLRAATQQEE